MLGIGSAAWHKHLDSNMESALAVFHVSAVVCSLSGSWQGNEGCSPALVSDPSNTCSSWPKVRTQLSLDLMYLSIINLLSRMMGFTNEFSSGMFWPSLLEGYTKRSANYRRKIYRPKIFSLFSQHACHIYIYIAQKSWWKEQELIFDKLTAKVMLLSRRKQWWSQII